MILESEPGTRAFEFERDTFTFPNELVWEYRIDPATGVTTTFSNDPPPSYAHRCFVMVRSARQFFFHARFDPSLPATGEPEYRRLIRKVVTRTPRKPSPPAECVVIPGYDCLRSFSRAREAVLKAECGGPWASYFVRSHWRMVCPIWPSHQQRMARRLHRAVQSRFAPIAHIFRFPRITINHGIILYHAAESGHEIAFEAYDPNIPDHPVQLTFDGRLRSFAWPRTHYWAGGPVRVVESYRGGLY